MRIRHAVAAVALLFTLAPVFAQVQEPSFTLNSNQTYYPGQKPQIAVWAHNVNSLEFRTYRVQDPVRFFGRLQEQHQFGGPGPRIGHERTWLESYHAWKHRVWIWIRDLVRAQFSGPSRARVREWQLERHVRRVSKVESYAQVPFLNRQQLVATWGWVPEPGARAWGSQGVPVPVKDPGVYLVEATDGALRAYTIVIVTEIAIITKTSPGQVVNFVVDRKSGAPVSGATLLLWVDRKQVGKTTSDKNGLAVIPVKSDKPENVSVLALDGQRFAINAPYGWGLSTSADRQLQAYGFTDRPVYRPGDTVHYKFIVRSRTPEGYVIPQNREIRLEMHDPSGNLKLQKTGTLSDMGTLSGEYAVPADAPLGYWELYAHLDDIQLQGISFYVEEYKKPEYEVRVTTEAPRVVQGQPIKATIDARYYFGEPVSNAKVTWAVHRMTWWAWERYADEEETGSGDAADNEGEEDAAEYDYGAQQTEEQSGRLDADGKLQISIPTAVDDKKYDARYRIEARVTDEGNREIAGAGYALATYAGYYLNATPERYLYKPGEIAKIGLEARDYEGHPISTSFRAELSPWGWRESDRGHPVWNTNGRTDNKGNAELAVKVPSAGEFRMRIVAPAAEGREVESSSYLWVPGTTPWWDGSQAESVKIVADKKEYKPGDVAHLLVMVSPEASHVLVTVEGAYLYRQQVLPNRGGSVVVDVPIKREYAPSVYLGASYILANKLYSGHKQIAVPPTEHELKVELKPANTQYKPGDAAVYVIRARDASGHPVQGELSLGVVDEAIYAIRPDTARNILSQFYGRVYDQVGTHSSLTYYFSGSAGKRAMQLANLRPSRSLAELKPERLVQPRVRKAFPDTAYWVADLHTDANGEARAKFDFPDAVTTWRATARGITRDTKVGSAVEKTLVRKDLIVRLVVPRFFRQGDEVTVSTIVHNYLPAAKTARVDMEFDGLQVLAGSAQDANVASHGEAKVDWRVRVQNAGHARVLGKALTDQESDAMELSIPIKPYGVKVASTRTGTISTNGEQSGEVVFPANAEPGTRNLEVSISPSVAGAMFTALDYLTSYPYGCTEQTMSSFLPNVLVRKTLKDLGVKSNVNPAELQKKVRAGMERLYDYQHDSGAWGWWKTDDDDAFMTAYVVAGLGQAREAGYEVRPEVLERARNWLRIAVLGGTKLSGDMMAYVAYAFAASGSPDTGIIEAAWGRRTSMSPAGIAVLGLAMKAANDARASEVGAELENRANVSETEAWWESHYDWLMDFPDDSSPETTALALKLLTAVNPDSILLPKAAQYLVNHRDEGYYWTSTKQTAMIVSGLADYVKQSGELDADFTAQVFAGDRQVLSKHFTAADAMLPPVTARLAEAQLAPGNNKVRVLKSGGGRLYWVARGESYSADKRLTNNGSRQLSAVREYFKLTPARKADRIVYRLESMPDTVSVGDVIAVRITVAGSDWRYLMVEDPIPAGTEAIARDDLYQFESKPSWWQTRFTQRELHDDRTTFFQRWFNRGQHEFVYLLKVVNPGQFRVSPARVEPMYQPQNLATTDGRVVTVK